MPFDLKTDSVRFERGDACDLRADLGTFDLVLMANLIDRLPDPAKCLARLPGLISSGGWLVITSPYTWLEEYTPRERWLDGGGRGTFEALRERLAKDFELGEVFDLPFLIREHRPQISVERGRGEPVAAKMRTDFNEFGHPELVEGSASVDLAPFFGS